MMVSLLALVSSALKWHNNSSDLLLFQVSAYIPLFREVSPDYPS